jgi:hypothetical protein
MSTLTTCANTRSVTSSPELAAGHSHCGAPAGPTTDPSGPVRARANHSARQARMLDLTTSGTYGRHSSTSSASVDLKSGLVSRLRTRLPGSTLFKTIWKEKATPSGRLICRLAASARRTSVADSGLLLSETPVSATVRMGDSCSPGLQERIGDGRVQRETVVSSAGQTLERRSDACGLAYSDSRRRRQTGCDAKSNRTSRSEGPRNRAGNGSPEGVTARVDAPASSGAVEDFDVVDGEGRPVGLEGPRPTDGFWRDADWIRCQDGKWRPVEPGTFPLAHGVPARVGRLRGYGNAINPELAAEFIRAYSYVRGLPFAQR